MTVPNPLINGHRYSFASIEANINGIIIRGFSEITYSQALEPGEVRGTGPQLQGLTRGDLKAEGSLGLYEEDDTELIGALGEGFLEQYFPIVVNFSETILGVRTDTIVGARLKNGARSFQKGTEGLVVKRDIMAFYILENGIPPIFNLQR